MYEPLKRPRYRTARLLLGVTTFVGIMAIVGGDMALAGAFAGTASTMLLALGAGLILNGLLVAAGAQMGSATLDTAVSTRQTADAVATLVGQASQSASPTPIRREPSVRVKPVV